MTTLERLRDEVFQLPANERTSLAHDLLASLENEPVDEDSEVELVALIRERSRQLNSGEVVGLDWRESLVQARAELASRMATLQ